MLFVKDQIPVRPNMDIKGTKKNICTHLCGAKNLWIFPVLERTRTNARQTGGQYDEFTANRILKE